jgi:hypothetical protein
MRADEWREAAQWEWALTGRAFRGASMMVAGGRREDELLLVS